MPVKLSPPPFFIWKYIRKKTPFCRIESKILAQNTKYTSLTPKKTIQRHYLWVFHPLQNIRSVSAKFFNQTKSNSTFIFKRISWIFKFMASEKFWEKEIQPLLQPSGYMKIASPQSILSWFCWQIPLSDTKISLWNP